MNGNLALLIFYALLIYGCVFMLVWSVSGGFCFNVRTNYRKRWRKLNWFGVWFFTILYWIVFLPFAIIAAILWLFTVGRK